MREKYLIVLMTFIVALVCAILFWEVQHIFPSIKNFRETISIWLVILSAAIFFSSGFLLLFKNNFGTIGNIILLTAFFLSMFFLRFSLR